MFLINLAEKRLRGNFDWLLNFVGRIFIAVESF